MNITIDDVLSWMPCERYDTREKLLAVTGGRESMTHIQVADLPIPLKDVVWVLVEALHRMPHGERDYSLFVCDYVERALFREREAGREPDERSWNAVFVAREFAMGRATEEELIKVDDSFLDVVFDSFFTAAYSERQWQIHKLIKYLEAAEKETQ
jgi:hypothetical protein